MTWSSGGYLKSQVSSQFTCYSLYCLWPVYPSVSLSDLSVCLSSGLQGKPSSWAVLSQDRQTKVLLSIGPELYILDNTSCTAVVRQLGRQTSRPSQRDRPVSNNTCLFVFSVLQVSVHRLAALSTCLCLLAINILRSSLTMDTCGQAPLNSRWAAPLSNQLFEPNWGGVSH